VSGSYPRKVSLNPFLPASAPWHAPELQPILVRTGITSLRKLHVNGALASNIADAAQGWRIEELHTEEGRLDEVFRTITLPDTAKEGETK
jgi:hypothetical protein